MADDQIEDLREELSATQTALVEEMERADSAERAGMNLRYYERAADELGVKPEFRDDVYRLLGYSGDVDPASVKAAVAEFLKANPKYWDGKVRVSRRDFASMEWRNRNPEIMSMVPDGKVQLV